MRKILSVFLMVAMLVSLIAVIPFGVSAETAKPQTLTFDTVAQQNYYASGSNLSATLGYSNDPAQGEAIRLDTIVRESNSTWISAVRIAQVNSDGSVSAYELKAGLEYTIKFKIKAENLDLGNGGTAGLRLYHVSQHQNMSSFLFASGKTPLDWSNTYITDVAATTNGWIEVSHTFTAPSDIESTGMTQLALTATYNYLGPWKATEQQLWIDNISIDPADSGVETYFSTYETEEEATFNTNVCQGNPGIVDTGDAAQGKAVHITRVAAKNNGGTPYSHSVRVAGVKNGAITSFKVVPGASYTITFKYKNKNELLSNGSAITDFRFYLMNVKNANRGYFLGAASKSADEWSHIDLGAFDHTKLNEWIKVQKTFTVPTTIGALDELVLMPVTTGGWDIKDADMYIDDLQVIGGEEASPYSTYVTGDESVFYGNSSHIYSVNVVDTADDAHGKALQFTNFGSSGGNTSYGMWPQAVKIASDNGVDPFVAKLDGRQYEISFDIKQETATNNFYLYAYFCSLGSNVGKCGYRDYVSEYSPKIAVKEFTAGTTDWQRVTLTITTPAKAAKGKDTGELTFILYSDVWGGVKDQSVLIDNISVKALTKVTLHNGALDGQVKWVDPETNLSDLQYGLAGAKVSAWYNDADLTNPAYTKVGYFDRELWAAWESVVINFDNGNDFYSNIYEDISTFNVEKNIGVTNSNGLTDAKENGTVNINSSWPNVLQLNYADNTVFKTYAGHTYRVRVSVKAVPNSVNDVATLFLAYKKPGYGNEGPLAFTYPQTADQYYTETAISMKTAFRNADGTYSDTPTWHTFTFEFEGLDDAGLPVYLVPWLVGCYVTIDDIEIVDITAQKVVTDTEGNELARGYIGEKVTIPALEDDGATNFIHYADADGSVVTEMTLKNDVQLTAVTSQIAVTAAEADFDKDMISFKVLYDGIIYEAAEGTDINVKKVTVGNKRYDVEEIGILVLPKVNAAEALTLENYETLGAVKVSNGDLKYSAAGESVIEIKAGIITSVFTREYTVVGYIKYGDNVIYSETRAGIAESFNAAADIEAVDASDYTHGDYRLVYNSEFNEDGTEDVTDHWQVWGSTYETDDGVTRYSTADAAFANDGNMVLRTTVTSETSMDIPYMLSNYRFTTGYLEVRAKYADFANTSGSIWLNFPGISQSEYVYPETETDIYVNAEIDIVEFLAPTRSMATLHSWGTKDGVFGQAGQLRLEDINGNDPIQIDLTEWHVFGFERTADYMRIYVDGVLTYEYTVEEAIAACCKGSNNNSSQDYNWLYRTENEVRALFENPTYLILSTGFASAAKVGTVSETLIDYVRFYE